MIDTIETLQTRGVAAIRPRIRRTGYLIGAVCIAICTVTLLPMVVSVLASVKPTAEAAQQPPTYVPHAFSLDSYRRLWTYQEGLPNYLLNSFGTAMLTILFTLLLTVPAAYALARFPVPLKEFIFVILLLALIVPYQALLTPIFLMFAKIGLTNSLLGLAILHTADPVAVQPLRAAKQLRRGTERARGSGRDGRCLVVPGALKIFLRPAVPAIVTVALFAFITSWNEFLGALVMMSRSERFTLPLILAAPAPRPAWADRLGMLQAGITISTIPCVLVYLLLQRYYVSGLMSGAVK
jgi:multiple sugar transport system permease protein